MIYLDSASTTKPLEEAVKKSELYLFDLYGNASGLYFLGDMSKNALNVSRDSVASLIKARPDEIYFTSGGTESDNLGIIGVAKAHNFKGRIITSTIEHHAVSNTCRYLSSLGMEIDYINVDSNGCIDIQEYTKAFMPDTVLVCTIGVNNEINTLQDLKLLSNIAHDFGVPFMTDFVQGLPHSKIDVQEYGIDILTGSAHKFGGIKGTGFIYIKDGIKVQNLMYGGSQEMGLRPSTENVFGNAVMGYAAQKLEKDFDKCSEIEHIVGSYLIESLKDNFEDIVTINSNNTVLMNVINVRFSGVNAVKLQQMLALYGIYCSVGSACNNGSKKPSDVLKAIGLTDEQAYESIRFSINYENSKDDVDALINVLKRVIPSLIK